MTLQFPLVLFALVMFQAGTNRHILHPQMHLFNCRLRSCLVSVSSATLEATAIAAILLGCVQAIILPSSAHPAPIKYCGNWVDFPHPVSPTIMVTCLVSTAYKHSSLHNRQDGWLIPRLLVKCYDTIFLRKDVVLESLFMFVSFQWISRFLQLHSKPII